MALLSKIKYIQHKMGFDYLNNCVWTFLILKRIQRDTIDVDGSSCKVPAIRVKFSEDFKKNTQIVKFIKIRPVESKLFHAERRTNAQIYMMKLTVTFRKFANAPKNSIGLYFAVNKIQ
jgi:hypothetical protein